MRAVVSSTWLSLAALLTGACALTGYDFGDYERAPHDRDFRPGVGGEGGGGEGETGGANSGPEGAQVASTFGVGGAGAASAGSDAGQNTAGACQARSCFEQGLLCGPADDTCGQPLDCGGCFWWFQECRQNRCEIPE